MNVQTPIASTPGKINADPRCENPQNCMAKGFGACRHCHFRHQAAINNGSATVRERQKKAWADPAKRAARVTGIKKAWADPAKRAARVTGIKKAWADPAKRAAHAERQKKAWADPAKRAARDILSLEQKKAIAHEVSETKRPLIEIGLDWLITSSRVSSIAKEFGVQRRTTGRSAT